MDFSKIKLNSGKEEKVLEEAENTVVAKEVRPSGGLRFDRFPKGNVSSLSKVFEEEEGEVAVDSSAVASESLAFDDEVLADVGGGDFGNFLEDLLDDEVGSDVAEDGSDEVVGEGEASGEWDDQLADLLDDEEAFVEPLVSSNVTVKSVPEVVVTPVVKGVKKVAVGKGEKRKVARRGKRVKLHSKSSVYRRRKGGLESEMGARGGLEYVVGPDGVLMPASRGKGSAENFAKLVEAAESHRGVALPEDFLEGDVEVVTDGEVRGSVVYPWSNPREVDAVRGGKERLGGGELSFYREFGLRKSEVVAGDFGQALREPVGSRESGRVERVRKSAVRRGVGGHVGYANHVGSAVTLRDQEVLQFLAKFKYATAKQLSNLSGVRESTSWGRLVALREKGLVDNIRLWGATPVWVLTGAGMVLSGFDLPLMQPSKISYALIGHQFVVNNTASNLMGGKANVLHLSEFPLKNRVDSRGVERWGEEVVSETEIQSSFSKMRLLTKADVYRPLILSTLEREFDAWDEGGRKGLSPEFMFGNEYMWMLFPPKVLGQVYHAPDFVVRRPRNADGSPESIAVEVEINSKAEERYDRVLRVFKADDRIYKKVIWVCKSMQAAKILEKVAKDIGLWQEGRIDIVPITTREGIFEGRDLWTI